MSRRGASGLDSVGSPSREDHTRVELHLGDCRCPEGLNVPDPAFHRHSLSKLFERWNYRPLHYFNSSLPLWSPHLDVGGQLLVFSLGPRGNLAKVLLPLIVGYMKAEVHSGGETEWSWK